MAVKVQFWEGAGGFHHRPDVGSLHMLWSRYIFWKT